MAAVSCKEIKASEKQVVSGKYWLSTIKPNMALLAHCDMTTGGMLLCLIFFELPLGVNRRPIDQLVERRITVREAVGSNPGRTNTQGL